MIDLINSINRLVEEHEVSEIEVEEVARPTYTDEELEKLIGFIKRMTTLYDLQESDWNELNYIVIRNFLMEPTETILTIYFNDDTLECFLDIPDVSFTDLTYFLREPNEIFKVETFHDKITFGTVNSRIEGSVLHLIECVFTPFFTKNSKWPDSKYFFKNFIN